MVLKCPKCGHPRPSPAGSQAVCSACGLVFAKWAQRVLGYEPTRPVDEAIDTERPLLRRVEGLVLPAPERVDPIRFYGRCGLYAVLFVWGLHFVSLDLKTNEIGSSIMHPVNLAFHEAGHVIFMPFGHFVMVLGGTLGQLLMPLIVGLALLYRNRDAFGASVALWWLGQSFMDIAPYINDARDLQLMLLGGGNGRDLPGTHDWENILLDLGLVDYERQIALCAERLGEGLLLLALVWGAVVLQRQWAAVRRRDAHE